jgi:hypothetical protein
VTESLLVACKALCDSIKLMGQLACFNELWGDWDNPEVDTVRIENEWLDHVAVCQGDAYRAGRAAIDEAEAIT